MTTTPTNTMSGTEVIWLLIGGATLLYAGLRFLHGYLLRRHWTPPERDPDHQAPGLAEKG